VTIAAPIMARLAITADEWASLRKAAIDDNTTTSKLLARLVRAELADRGEKTK
jgi:hypothetical protein